jgi:hypothetical protein
MPFIRPFSAIVIGLLSLFACRNPVVAPAPVSPRKTVQAARDPFDRHCRLIFTRHARCRMDCRHITKTEIREVLDSGTINYAKSEPQARPDPKYALEGYTDEHQHLRIVVAPSDGKLIVITCIELGVEWQCHCN